MTPKFSPPLPVRLVHSVHVVYTVHMVHFVRGLNRPRAQAPLR